MANTYTLIGSYAATGSVASIDFTSIPATYTDLLIKLSVRSSRADITEFGFMRFNSNSANYSTRRLFGNGSTAQSSDWGASTEITYGIINAANNTASTFSNCEIYIPNYAGSSNKSVSIDTVQEGNTATNIYANLNAGLWSNTAAITAVNFSCESGNYVQYSTAYLYGISKT